MTVKELIEELQRFKPEQEVVLHAVVGMTYTFEEVNGVNLVHVSKGGFYRQLDPHGKEAALIC